MTCNNNSQSSIELLASLSVFANEYLHSITIKYFLYHNKKESSKKIPMSR